ncbi:MAG: glycosyltransferase family 39 protein [Candidatus Promineifilaceae bacterium]|nr:glycosyltransferase family 39 protein [Candidatus Promineifilaceae bacterium]
MNDSGFRPSRGRLSSLLLLAGVFVIIAVPRWLVVSQTATEDETKWVARAANFSVALSSGDLAGTFQSEHPGVTAMWAGTWGLKALFPGYVEQEPGSLEPYQVDLFLLSHGYTPLQALAAGRRIMVLFNALALTLVYFYARRLLDPPTALLAVAFYALSPFLAAHTHLMHLDGLAGSLMLLSLLAFLAHFEWQRKSDLLLAGVASGLAWSTKTPALALGPILLLITLILVWMNRANKPADWQSLRGPLLSLLIWAGIGLLTLFLVWPALWVEPADTLNRILQGAVGYAGGGHGTPVFFNGTIYDDGRIPATAFTFYPLTYLWRSTPVTLIGIGLIVPALWRRLSPTNQRIGRDTIVALLSYAVLFTLFMTLGSKKFDRYLIPIYPALHLVSASGWVSVSRYLSSRWLTGSSRKALLFVLVLILLAAWQFSSVRSVYPYYLSYYNPLMGGSSRAPQVMQIGWGEGLDAAGRYLNDKPGSRDLNVASWYPSSLSYYFAGEKIPITAELTAADLAAIEAADYAVLYIHQWQRGVPAALLDKFVTRDPEHIIELNGLEYVRIYNLQP